jgi:subtilase family serine protease
VADAQPVIVSGAGSVDLVLEDMQVAERATLVAGPAYRVKFRNQGLQAAGQFRVALFATADGQVTDESPKALLDVPGLAAGQSAEVVLRLPAASMKMVSVSTGQAVAFSKLLVAVDFDNTISESDETNNVAVVDRTDL